MDRRNFLAASAAAAATLGIRHAGATTPAPAERIAAPTLAGMTLEQLRDKYRHDLLQSWLPFMEEHVIDHELGGFMCDVGPDGVRRSTNKDGRYLGRGAWTWSYLYNNIDKDPRHLEVARKALEFIETRRPSDPDMPLPRLFSKEGKDLSGPSADLFTDLFFAEGCAQYYKATGDEKYWDTAIEVLFNQLRRYDSPDFTPNISPIFLGLEEPVPLPGARFQGVWMVMVITCTQMLQMKDNPRLRELSERCVDAIIDHHYNPDFGLNNEFINHDLSRPDNAYARESYLGHSIETLWMVLQEAVRREDAKLFTTTADRFKRHVEVAWDDVYGGVFHNLQNVDENRFSLDKNLWPQEEVLIGSLLIHEHTGDDWSRDWFTRTHKYAYDHFQVKDSPLGAYWINAGERVVEGEKGSFVRAENYHHPRHFMLCLQALERIIARGGNVSGLLA